MQSVAASSADDVSMLVKRDQNCQAADENAGEPCGETGGLRILDDFRKLYESRIEKIDRESAGESDRVSMKLQIMSDWIKDLGEQNAMLVHTVEDLEQTACSRVKLLEEKLKQSSQMVVDNLAISNHSEKTLNTLSNRVSQLEKDEEYLQQKIEYLQSDIRGLLEVIRRARRQNIWSLEGITFFEIQPEDIPISVDCVCGQEQVETEYIKSLNLQVGQLQENEKRLTRSHLELEGKIADLTTELLIKDETIKKYVSRLQCFCEKLKEHAKQTNQVISHPLTVTDQDCNIILIPDILESVLDAKDTENQSLRRQLQDIESKLMVHTYENNIDTNNLRIQLEEKCKRIQELEDKVACLEKETVDTRDTLTAEIATLEKQNYHANIGNLLKDDLIKEMRKGLKQATLEDMPSRKVCIDTSNFPERCSLPSIDTSPPKKDEFITFLNSTKVHVQKECDILSDLKFELGKFVEKLAVKDNEMKKEQNHCTCGESKNIKSYINRRQFKLMEEYRICTVEVQAATEDIREEISTVLSSFNSRHQNYEELSEVVTAVQSHLEEERLRHSERIINGKLKLKDIKNEINQAQSEFSHCINGLQENTQEQSIYCTFDNQEVNDIIKMKEELHKLKKEYNDLKLNMIQQTCQMKHDEKLNKWKNRVIDLEDQIRMLQHEVKCKQEANNFLKNSIQSTERELMAARKKADCYRQSHSRDSMELKKKITELENIIREESSLSSVSAKSVMTLTESLGKCREKLDMCSHELSKLKSAVYSKEKLLENMEEVIRIQRDSLTMSQAEVKDLHQKLQEKIDKQNLVIAQYERDKNELTKQNELQIQTIGHLQNAVVEAKRNLDQMGHKAMSDEQIYDHVKDLRELKWKMNSFMETKNLSDGKYMSKSCTIYFDKNCDTQDLEYSSDDMKCETSYMEKYSDKEVILSELNASEYEMLVILCDRVYSLKTLLQEKSDNMVKLQADYELLKNENAILKKQSDVIEIQTKDDILKLKKMEKDYCSKIGEIENEAANLRNLVDKLNEELEETKRKLTLKDVELCQTQDTCKSYADHLNTIRQDLEKEKEEVTKAENINRDLIQQLQDYINDNYHLGQQKFSLEQDNSTYATEKCFMQPIKTGQRRVSTCGDSWWFPKMEHVINEVRKSNQWWNENFSNETESDISLEESRDYGYQSSSTSK
ncbi:hypothetical protein DMN91_003502 [Ooceraea biroi]|uniref:Uncharacterized protein n=1 Tax=Ooceraea biroi TaxID=2015173 RepID=A0A3L8DU70_OOCBI|nr:hypothetical protein DMN91_003502 [Ooceraea biroi]